MEKDIQEDIKEEQEVLEQDTEETDGTDEPEEEGIELKDTTEKPLPIDESIIKKREARAIKKTERKYEKELAELKNKMSKYEKLENTMKLGTGKENLDEIITETTEFYKEQGIEIPDTEVKTQTLKEKEIEILATAEANEILELDIEDIEEEANAMAKKGYKNMTNREKLVFDKVCQTLKSRKEEKVLVEELGAENVIKDARFQELRSKYTGDVKEVYELYTKLYGEDKSSNAGSLENTTPTDDKDYYTESEAIKKLDKLSPSELAKNPKLLDKLKNSMHL